MSRRFEWRRVAFTAAMAFTLNCGGSPAQPSPPPITATVFSVIPEEVLLGPGDNEPVFGLAGTSPSSPVEVTDRMRLESANPAIIRVDGTHVVGVAPGQADVRATFQSLTATVRATVFPASAVSRLEFFGTGSGGGGNPCWPNDGFELGVTAVLDSGTRLVPKTVAWRSTAPAVVAVDAGKVTCLAPGEGTIDAAYQGRTVSMPVSVRAPQDALEPRGSSTTGSVEHGRTISIANYGFYVLASAASGEIVQSIDTAEGASLAPASTLRIVRGSDTWRLTTTFTIPATANSVCARVVMRVDGSSRELEIPRRCDSVR